MDQRAYATLAVQVAPESDEYADPVCQEQAMLLNARVKMRIEE